MDKFTKFSSQKLIHLSIENFKLILEFETGRNRPVNRKKNNTAPNWPSQEKKLPALQNKMTKSDTSLEF